MGQHQVAIGKWGPRASSKTLFHAACCLLALLPYGALAQTWNVKTAVRSPLNDLPNFVGDPNDEDNKGCTAPGTCLPQTIALGTNTLWYWCGWRTERTSNYYVEVKSGPSISVLMMKQKALEECAIGDPSTGKQPEYGLSGIKNCETVYSSKCTAKKDANCTVQTFALAFPDDSCFLLANNDNNKTATVMFQFYQTYSSSRYYGAVFSIILTIILLGGVLTYLGFACHREWTTSHDRIAELRTLEAAAARKLALSQGGAPAAEANSRRATAEDGQQGEEGEGPDGAFRSRVNDAMVKVRRAFKRTTTGSPHQQ